MPPEALAGAAANSNAKSGRANVRTQVDSAPSSRGLARAYTIEAANATSSVRVASNALGSES